MLAWLSVWSKVQTCIWPSWCHCHSPSLASVKSRLVLPFWYRLTRVVWDKWPLNVCVCVCKWHANSCELHYFRYGGPSPWRAELTCYIPHVRRQAPTIIITTVLRPLYRSTCVSRYLLLRTRGFCWCKVLPPTSLLTATSAFGLGRRCWSSPQQCYLHCLHTLSCHKRIVNVLPLFDEMAIPLFFLATLLADLLSSPSQCLCKTDNTVLILFL